MQAEQAGALTVSDKPTTPMQMIAHAVANGAPVETMEKLLALQERWEAGEARKAFVAAMSAFKAKPPEIFRNRAVSHDRGKSTVFTHATLDNVCDALNVALASHGLSFRWETEQLEQGIIRVTCILTHAAGHSERTALQSTPDTSGSKNHVQAVGSTVTYLQRYTLLAATGIAVQGQDDDGAQGQKDQPITPEQVASLQAGLDETGADIQGFCKYMRVGALAEITMSGFGRAVAAIDAKRKKAGSA
ncbi:MAG: hypothetical protein VR70_14480 [Rhodospirillaceae bacterium BRH_c57]|nr:MAG: hypothetical protein VR70_14480 [Rhodospirillaceae bacterium BRH_c57]